MACEVQLILYIAHKKEIYIFSLVCLHIEGFSAQVVLKAGAKLSTLVSTFIKIRLEIQIV